MTILKTAGVIAGSAMSDVLARRGAILQMIKIAEDAVLRPKDSGAFGPDLRAALAARIARLAGADELSLYYGADAGRYAALADPKEDGSALGLITLVSFVDRVAAAPRDVGQEDITQLKAASIGDADIVRLCELIAFLAFQLRVVSGLQLMVAASA